jgi:hypothetical protein
MFHYNTSSSKQPYYVLKVLPNKLTYAWVLWYGLVGVVNSLVHSLRPFDWHIINVGDGDVRDFSLQNEGDIIITELVQPIGRVTSRSVPKGVQKVV